MRTFSDSGSSLAWQIVTVVAAVVLLVHRRWRLAAFVMVTIAGSSLVHSAVKATENRDRPAVDQPFVNEPGASFPSGHSQDAATVESPRSVAWPQAPECLGTLRQAMLPTPGFTRVRIRR